MEQDWYKYVYKYPEGLIIRSSGIVPHLMRICPDCINSHSLPNEMIESLQRLKEYAKDHITIYRAIKYAAEFNPHSIVRQEARDILGSIKRPTTYTRMVPETVNLPEDDDATT